MATARFCNGCLKPIPMDAPQGLCPECLVKGGFDTEGHPPTAAPATPPEARFMPPTPGELANAFPQLEILELLGQGGMGVVYKARQPQLDRLVALKILPPAAGRDPSFAERFTREARALARLNHPNIVSVYDFGQAREFYYFIMEFVDGVNLRQLEQSRRIAPAEALGIVPKICEALQYAHEEGIVHRDIKPGNILLDKKGRVKIADFGLAKLLDKEANDFTLTRSQQVMGTPHYMAPEQIEKPQEVDHRADIYSLGVVFYEMLTGELPMGRFAPPSQKVQVDVRVDEVVLHSLERDVERRYQHVSEVRTDVESITGIMEKLPPTMRELKTDVETISKRAKSRLRLWTSEFGILLASWLAPAALWNLRSSGLFVAALILGALFTALTSRRAQLVPALAQSWNHLSRAQQRVNILGAVFVAFLGYCFLIGALETRWEAAPSRWQGRAIEKFAASYKGHEHILVRQLTAFKEQVPTVELSPSSFTWRGFWQWGWGTSGPHEGTFGWLPILLSGALASLCLALVLWSLVAPWRLREMFGSFWLTALRHGAALTATALLSALAAYMAMTVADMFDYSGPRKWLNRSVRGQFTAEQTAQAIEEWAQRAGYATGDQASWLLATVPKGEVVGEVRLIQAWKPSPFDRWRMTWRGLKRISPHLVLKTISGSNPVETVVNVDSIKPPEDPRLGQKWKTTLDDLESAIKNAPGEPSTAGE
ncbi:MAG: hypothetical protein DME21_05905 [Verrucomicrobia bacterium]|nr:MAG: hypothetical protein DME21_05905 [Verrucomicrobiota bacterium]